MSKLQTIHRAMKLGVRDEHRNLRMLVEHSCRVLRIERVKGLETRFAQNVGSDQPDKRLIFND